MNEMPKDLTDLYAEYGITAEKAQVLEVEAGNVALAFVALWVGTDKLDDEKKQFYASLMDDVNRKTLGKLLKQIKKTTNFDGKGIEIIDEALEKRNYFTHHYFRKHNFAIFNEEGRKEMVRELKEIQKQLDLAHAFLSSLSSLLSKQSGLAQNEATTKQLIEKGKRLKI